MNPNKKVLITVLSFVLAMVVIACSCSSLTPTTTAPVNPMPALEGYWQDTETNDVHVIEWQNGQYVVTAVNDPQYGSFAVTSQSWNGSVLTWTYKVSYNDTSVTFTTVSVSGNTLNTSWSNSMGDSGTQEFERVSSPNPYQSSTGGQTSNVLFQDDFSNSNSGWSVRSSEGSGMEYSSGGYRIYVAGTYSDLVAEAGQSLPADVIIDVDVTNAGIDNNDFGVICRMRDLDNFYFFQLASDGYAVIGKFENNQAKYLSSEGMQKVDGIYSGSTTNHMRAECIGNSFKLYANGSLVAQVTDSTFTSGGDVGLMAGTFDVGGVDILFDNFVVTRP
jgi:hypothetical protein